MKRSVVIGAALWLALAATARAEKVQVLGTAGATYAIAERDIEELMMERAAALDVDAINDKIAQGLEDWRPERPQLDPARENRTRKVAPSLELPFDVPSSQGVYPKGYQLPMLQYAQLSEMFVVLDAARKDEVAWFLKSPYLNNLQVTLLLSGGDLTALDEKIKQRAYYLSKNVAKAFDLKVTPTVVRQVGQELELTEVRVSKGGKR